MLLWDLSKVDEADRSNAINGVVQVIDRRVNAYGVAEPVIQSRARTASSSSYPAS